MTASSKILTEPLALVLCAPLLGAISTLGAIIPQRLLVEVGLPPLRHSKLWATVLAATLVGLAMAALCRGEGAAIMATATLAGACLVLVAVFDGLYLLIPDLFNATLAALALALLILRRGAGAVVVGGLVCAGLLYVVRVAWLRFRGEDGLGFGDVKLAGALGLLFGLEVGLWIVSGAALSGAIFGVAMERRAGSEGPKPVIPFGVFLSLAGLVALALVRP